MLGVVLAGCQEALPEPAVVDLATSDPDCAPLFVDPRPLEVPRPTPLEQAAAWSRVVDGIGSYGHQVAIDALGRAVWVQDSANMRFTVRTVAPDGEVLRVQVLDPPTMAPGVLATGPDGTVVAGGTVFDGDGPALTAMGPDGTVRWRQGTPRVGVEHVVPLPDGGWAFLGNSGRDSVTLGTTTHQKTAGWRGSSMDVLAALDAEGAYRWSRAFHPGALDLAVQDGDLFVGSHLGKDGQVDYGGGPVFATGVLARLRPDGSHVWSRGFDEGLYDVIPWGPRSVLVSGKAALVDGTEVYARTRVHAVGPDGCDRGSVDLGDLARLRPGADGSLVAYGLRIGGPPRLGATAVDVAEGEWWIARFTPDLVVDRVHTIACDDIEAAAGRDGEVAVSCTRDLSVGSALKRRTVLYWIPPS